MDWLNQMNAAIVYLEKNLDDELDYKKAADIVHCSVYHFQKIFGLMAGIPVSEYVRRRRLSKAAFDLQNSDEKILDVALKYGYQSPTAFNRAFQSMHGIAPSEARKKGVSLCSFPPIVFHISIKGAVEMNYRIEEKSAFRVVGARLHTSMENEQGFKEIPAFWAKASQDGTVMKVCELMDGEPKGLMGISKVDIASGSSEFDYFIAVASHMECPKEFVELEIPAVTWAVFECIGPMPHTIQELSKRIMTEWLPSSGYEYGDAPDIELYSDGDNQAADYRCEIWLPVKKK